MRRMRVIGVCALGALVLSAVIAAAASAAVPELGKCVKVPSGGKFTNGACTTPAKTAKAGIWEFVPAAKKGFKAAFVPNTKGIAVTLETTSKFAVTCTGGGATGEYTGAKSSTETLKLTGCEAPSVHLKCRSLPTSAEGEITSEELEGELGFIVGIEKMKKVGIDLKPKAPGKVFAKAECGMVPAPLHVTLEGSVIGALLPINAMKEEFKLTFTQKGGKQSPEKFEIGAKDVLQATILLGTEKTEAEAGLAAKGPVKNEEALEIKAK